MTLFAAQFGGSEPVRTILTTTAAFDVLAPSNKQSQPIAKVHICNAGAAGITIDLWVFDGTTAFYLEKARPIAVGASFEMTDEILSMNHTLRAQCSVANAAHVHVMFSLPVRS